MKKPITVLLIAGLGLCLVPRAYSAETVDVTLTRGKITTQKSTVNPGDYLNICSRDEAFHQPYSIAPPNKFGSPKAKEKDMLSNGHCRIVEVRNYGQQTVEMTIYDRFVPSAYAVLKVNPKPRAPAVKGTQQAVKDDADTFPGPMQGNQRLAFCYSAQQGCGEKAAEAWCKVKGYKGVKEWQIEPRDVGKPKVTRYVGNDALCKRGVCDSFEYVTCRTGPPTFF